ncbi:MAG: M15 family metallopeptidase [Flavobacteriales bacterium]|nr:M15 family metallopeptidase [Flavobacteriales bacterium]
MQFDFKPNAKGIAILIMMIVLVFYVMFKKRKKLKQMASKTIDILKDRTWDLISDRRIAALHPLIRNKAKEFIIRAEKELGIKLRVTSTLRTWKEQEKLYAKGRTTPGNIVTNAKPGRSLHNYGLALDVVEIKNGKAMWNNTNWSKIGKLGKSLGFSWGGDWTSFKDKPHFEMRFGRSITDLQALYTSGNREGEYVNLA